MKTINNQYTMTSWRSTWLLKCVRQVSVSVDADAAEWRGRGDAVTSRGTADGEEERCENRGRPEEHDKQLRNDCARKHGKTWNVKQRRQHDASFRLLHLIQASNAWRASRIKVTFLFPPLTKNTWVESIVLSLPWKRMIRVIITPLKCSNRKQTRLVLHASNLLLIHN